MWGIVCITRGSSASGGTCLQVCCATTEIYFTTLSVMEFSIRIATYTFSAFIMFFCLVCKHSYRSGETPGTVTASVQPMGILHSNSGASACTSSLLEGFKYLKNVMWTCLRIYLRYTYITVMHAPLLIKAMQSRLLQM